MGQFPPFARNSGVLPARRKGKRHALGKQPVRLATAIICAVAALLIACSSQSTSTVPQVGNEPNNDTRPSAATATTGLPKATPAAETTPAQPVPSATVEPTNRPTPTAAPEAQPETATAPAATRQEPTATATTTTTTTTTVLRVTVSAVPATLPDYDRQDWKHWTDADRDCQDARNEVLIAESRTVITYRSDKKCKVATGEWLAPYSNTIVTDPGKLDVDHMVPLGNAHGSGAWQWSANRREQYANYLKDPQHLIAVTASANHSKGARGPEDWKPADRSYWCQYAVDWITIKYSWALTVTQGEHDALAEMLNTCPNRPQLKVTHQSQAGPTPVSTSAPARPTATDRRQRQQLSGTVPATPPRQPGKSAFRGPKSNGRGFPKWMVPSARDGDGDGVVCER